MSSTPFQKRVGLFVALCLVLAGALLLAFSKGASLFSPSYEIRVRLKSVGGLKERSAVLLAGIQVGHLKSVSLAPDGQSVLLHLRILRRYSIHRDADFVVEQIGVLGDQFVAIHPQANKAPLLQEGEEVRGRESLDLQDVAKSAVDLIKNLSLTLSEVREGVTNVNRGLLDPVTISNLSSTAANLRLASEHARVLLQDLGWIVQTNALPLTRSVSNLVRFSGRLEEVATHLDETILTNRESLRAAVNHFEAAGEALQSVARGLDAGEGVAGGLLSDPQWRAQAGTVFSNLAVLSSNLNRYGLLYKPKRQDRVAPSASDYPGKRP